MNALKTIIRTIDATQVELHNDRYFFISNSFALEVLSSCTFLNINKSVRREPQSYIKKWSYIQSNEV